MSTAGSTPWPPPAGRLISRSKRSGNRVGSRGDSRVGEHGHHFGTGEGDGERRTAPWRLGQFDTFPSSPRPARGRC